MTRQEKDSHSDDYPFALNEYGAPADMDEFRFDLARSIARFQSNSEKGWERCGNRECRRARACRTQDMSCPVLPPPPEMTAQEQAYWMADFQRQLHAYLAEIVPDEDR